MTAIKARAEGYQFVRVGDAGLPCPVCGHHRDGCMVSACGEAVACIRRPNGLPVKGLMGAWIHPWQEGRTIEAVEEVPDDAYYEPHEIASVLSQCRDLLTDDLRRDFAGQFEVDLDIADRMAVGYQPIDDAWTFPMFDADLTPIGIRLRGRGHRLKKTVGRTRNGMFLGPPISDEVLWVVEGPTDVAALASLGQRAVGVSSVNFGYHLVAEYAARLDDVVGLVWVVENDRAGREWADYAVERLGESGKAIWTLRIPEEPIDGERLKDIHDWYRMGVTADTLRLHVTRPTR